MDIKRKVEAEIKMWQNIMPNRVDLNFEAESPLDFLDYVSEKIEVPLKKILSGRRTHRYVFARQLIQSLAMVYSRKNELRWELKEVGRVTNITNHATVIHSMKSIYNMHQQKFEFNKNFKNWMYIDECFSELGLDTCELIKRSNYFLN